MIVRSDFKINRHIRRIKCLKVAQNVLKLKKKVNVFDY